MTPIVFQNPINVIIQPQKVLPAVTKTITGLTITMMIDNPIDKVITVQTKELGRITLWKDAEYDAIGQWTDSDVISKINQLYVS